MKVIINKNNLNVEQLNSFINFTIKKKNVRVTSCDKMIIIIKVTFTLMQRL